MSCVPLYLYRRSCGRDGVVLLWVAIEGGMGMKRKRGNNEGRVENGKACSRVEGER